MAKAEATCPNMLDKRPRFCRFGIFPNHVLEILSDLRNSVVQWRTSSISPEPPDSPAAMYSDDAPDHEERPWIVLTTTYDVEAWIDQFNRNLQRLAPNANAAGYGICFRLSHGGEIFLHTTTEGVVLLDVTEEAAWVATVLTAATGVAAPPAQIWQLPADTLTQLLVGLSGLIATTRIVLQHDYRIKKRY